MQVLDFSTYYKKLWALRKLTVYPVICGLMLAATPVDPVIGQNRNKAGSRNSTSQLVKVNRVNPILETVSLETVQYPESAADNTGSQNQFSKSGRISGQVYPIPALESVVTIRKPDGSYQLSKFPQLNNSFLDRRMARNQNGDLVVFTLNNQLQAYAEKLIKENHAPHVALIAIEPKSGKVLALAEKSSSIADLALHSGFPAASLFKVVTTAAAIDSGRLSPSARISYRGGTYELSESNYLPNSKKDKRSMSLGEALGKSCNPVFGRVAINFLNSKLLERYARAFGFDSKLPFDLDSSISNFEAPQSDYDLSRTAAGFGEVRISPLHAATLMSGLANSGLAKKPLLIDKIVSASGEVKYQSQPEDWLRIVPDSTADRLMALMVNTTTIGTSRKEFYLKKKAVLGNVRVAGKTGTLRGDNPAGLNNWFIGAPVDNPVIAVAAVVVDPGGISTKASRMGRLMIQKALAELN